MRNSSEPLPERRLEAKSCASKATGITGSQLLHDFVERRSQDAFTELVRIYGPMVYGVCRRVVGHHHDAEDAFQSTFLVLSQKAALIKNGEILFGWLYQVACHVSLRTKSEMIKRATKEKPMSDDCELAAAVPGAWVELEPILDEELSRLSEKYRLPILLCDLGGRTQKEAATELGWSQGTLSTRLTKARSILVQRLARHGVTLSAGALAVLISQQAASATVPATLMTATLQTAGVLSVGQAVPVGVTSSKVLALNQGMSKTILFVNVKLAAASVAVLVAIALGVQLQRDEPLTVANAVVNMAQPIDEGHLTEVIELLAEFESRLERYRWKSEQRELLVPKDADLIHVGADETMIWDTTGDFRVEGEFKYDVGQEAGSLASAIQTLGLNSTPPFVDLMDTGTALTRLSEVLRERSTAGDVINIKMEDNNTWIITLPSQTAKGVSIQVTLDRDRGCAVTEVSMRNAVTEQAFIRRVYHLAEQSEGIWLPDCMTLIRLESRVAYRTQLSEFEVNPLFSEDEFALEMPKGALVDDFIEKTSYSISADRVADSQKKRAFLERHELSSLPGNHLRQDDIQPASESYLRLVLIANTVIALVALLVYVARRRS